MIFQRKGMMPMKRIIPGKGMQQKGKRKPMAEMKIMTRIRFMLGVTAKMILLILILWLPGCAGIGSPQPAPQKNGSDGLPVLKIVADSEQAVEAIRMEEKEIEKRFHVRLAYYYPERLNDNLEEFLFSSSEPYDIYILFPAKLPAYVERQMIIPLDRYTADDPSLQDVLPIYRALYMHYGGHDYGMVYDGDAHLLFYRKDLFEKYGDEYLKKFGKKLAPPKSWAEFDQIAQFLTRDLDGDGKDDLYGTAIFGGDAKRYIWFLERYLSKGGAYFDEQMHPLISGPLGQQALEELVALQDKRVTPPHAMYDWLDLNHVFLNGKVAMVIQWSDTYRFTFDQQTWNSQVEGKVGFTQVPSDLEGAPRGGVWIGRIMAISSASAQPDKAWEVIRYLTSPQVSKRAVNSLNTVNDPYRSSHFIPEGKGPFPSEEENRSFLNALQESLQHPNADLMIPGGWEYMQVLDKRIGQALIREISVKEALEQTSAEWERITDRYGRTHQAEHYLQWKRALEAVKGGR